MASELFLLSLQRRAEMRKVDRRRWQTMWTVTACQLCDTRQAQFAQGKFSRRWQMNRTSCGFCLCCRSPLPRILQKSIEIIKRRYDFTFAEQDLEFVLSSVSVDFRRRVVHVRPFAGFHTRPTINALCASYLAPLAQPVDKVLV